VALSRRVRIAIFATGSILAALGLTCFILVERFEPVARDYVIKTLHERYKGDVQLDDLQISLFPTVHAVGTNLVVRMPGQPQPLISIRRLAVEARFIGFFRSPKHIRRLTLEGLQIHVPPDRGGSHSQPKLAFILDQVIANGSILDMLPSDPAKDPLHFDIEQLTMHTVGIGKPMTFHAELNNPKPPGFIHSDGEFGPWDRDNPAGTPLDGKYTFSNADLGVFKSISGTLSSSGKYRGKLSRLEVEGTAEVPNFALTAAGNPEYLRTRFTATVDGRNGNTDLHPVTALLGNSRFEVSGPIERNALEKGKEIDLTARSTGTGVEDFLLLAIKGAKPPLRGRVRFDTVVRIPPGESPVVQRLDLNGKFALMHVKFTSPDVQEKIASLSHRAQGDPKDTDTKNVTAQLAGRFVLDNGILTLPRLEFDVPGAKITMDGRYTLQSGDIDFKGTAKMDATISEMTTGFKRILLKPVDPLFKHDGVGTELPIRITGTRGSPSFRLDIGRVFKNLK
jgi:hypothetical protein